MIQLKPTCEIYDTVSSVFKKDTQLYMLYHYESPTSYDEAVDYSCEYNRIYVPKEAVFYAIYYYHLLVGYVSILDDCVWDFHISMQHRSEEVMDGSWDAVMQKMNSDFHIRLYERNYRDINWLLQEKSALPFKLENNKPGYYVTESATMKDKKQRHTYFREYSQILLKFNKTN